MKKNKIKKENIGKLLNKTLTSHFGFSLIELMVVVSILALVVLGLVTIFSGGMRSYISGNAQLEAQRNARQGMDRMVRELRHGKKVKTWTSHSITVIIPEIDEEDGYEVTYAWSGTPYDSMYRTVSGGNSSFIDNILNLDFDNAKSSRINIELEVDVDRDEKADISLNTAVTLRNF
ncbi:MAG: prepilin-type N-terminal cleavage/methylation domain-containing protein [Atribacterota bacterium]|jgi:prepilin-type N-terminal cleavage/methylation domain-containing protein|nr:prepilin-type N-terminal cleavage/methylation domain-containing protein [Atribacterota bacterium]MDD5636211.1 prepilin-type N-terminal cleavage/methylation domain-containing protein [Atribacterota bacterium]